MTSLKKMFVDVVQFRYLCVIENVDFLLHLSYMFLVCTFTCDLNIFFTVNKICSKTQNEHTTNKQLVNELVLASLRCRQNVVKNVEKCKHGLAEQDKCCVNLLVAR